MSDNIVLKREKERERERFTGTKKYIIQVSWMYMHQGERRRCSSQSNLDGKKENDRREENSV